MGKNKDTPQGTSKTAKGKADKTKGEKSKGGKDSQLLIRIAREDRAAFMETCQRLDTSAAREIRRFIRDFTEQHAEPAPLANGHDARAGKGAGKLTDKSIGAGADKRERKDK